MKPQFFILLVAFCFITENEAKRPKPKNWCKKLKNKFCNKISEDPELYKQLIAKADTEYSYEITDEATCIQQIENNMGRKDCEKLYAEFNDPTGIYRIITYVGVAIFVVIGCCYYGFKEKNKKAQEI